MTTQPHRCRDHLDYIGGHSPYECVVCGLRYDAVDLQPGGRLATPVGEGVEEDLEELAELCRPVGPVAVTTTEDCLTGNGATAAGGQDWCVYDPAEDDGPLASGMDRSTAELVARALNAVPELVNAVLDAGVVGDPAECLPPPSVACQARCQPQNPTEIVCLRRRGHDGSHATPLPLTDNADAFVRWDDPPAEEDL